MRLPSGVSLSFKKPQCFEKPDMSLGAAGSSSPNIPGKMPFCGLEQRCKYLGSS